MQIQYKVETESSVRVYHIDGQGRSIIMTNDAFVAFKLSGNAIGLLFIRER